MKEHKYPFWTSCERVTISLRSSSLPRVGWCDYGQFCPNRTDATQQPHWREIMTVSSLRSAGGKFGRSVLALLLIVTTLAVAPISLGAQIPPKPYGSRSRTSKKTAASSSLKLGSASTTETSTCSTLETEPLQGSNHSQRAATPKPSVKSSPSPDVFRRPSETATSSSSLLRKSSRDRSTSATQRHTSTSHSLR